MFQRFGEISWSRIAAILRSPTLADASGDIDALVADLDSYVDDAQSMDLTAAELRFIPATITLTGTLAEMLLQGDTDSKWDYHLTAIVNVLVRFTERSPEEELDRIESVYQRVREDDWDELIDDVVVG